MGKSSKGQGARTEQLIAFADIIAKVEAGTRSSAEILREIEKNTAVLPRLISLLSKGAVAATSTRQAKGYHEKAKQAATVARQRGNGGRPAPIAPAKATLPAKAATLPSLTATAAGPTPSSKKSRPPQVRSARNATSPVPPIIVKAEESKRDRKGRFQSKADKSASQQAQEQARADKKEDNQAKSIGAQIKDALKVGANHLLSAGKDKVQEVDTTEAAGRAAGGPIFDAARELQGAAADIKKNAEDESTLTGKAWRYVQAKRGKGEPGGKQGAASGRDEQGRFVTPVIKELQDGDKKEDKRHKEIIKAITKGKKKGRRGQGEGAPRNVRLPRGAGIRPPSAGGGGLAGGIVGPLMVNAIGPIAAAALPVVAVLGGLAAGFGALMLLVNKGKYNGWGQPLTPGQTNAIKPIPPTDIDKARWKDGLYNREINTASVKNGVNSNLIKAVIDTESEYNPKAKSKAGAQGLMQLMPRTAKELGVSDVNNPNQNIAAGTAHLSRLMKKYGGNEANALQAYNWGEGDMDTYLKTGKGVTGQDMPQETRDYAQKVLRNKTIYEQINSKNVQPAADANSMARGKSATPVANAAAVSNPADYEDQRAKFLAADQETTPQAAGAPSGKKKKRASPVPLQSASTAPSSPKVAEQIKTPPPAPVTASVPEVGQLAQAMQESNSQPQAQQKPAGNVAPMIKTEFDDTMLTLMAYDRV